MWKRILLVIAILFQRGFSFVDDEEELTNGVMRKISVKNGDGEECNFKNWGYLENRPDHYVTCTKDYYSKNRIGDSVKKTAQFPYCPMNVAGKWSYCLDYLWEYQFDDLYFSKENGKLYYFNYYNYGTTYNDARKKCRERGPHWDVANFKTNFESNLGTIHEDENYSESIKNLRGVLYALAGTSESKLNFWVRNDQSFFHLSVDDMNKNIHYNMNNCLVFDYNTSKIKYTSCGDKKTFVCEINLMDIPNYKLYE